MRERGRETDVWAGQVGVGGMKGGGGGESRSWDAEKELWHCCYGFNRASVSDDVKVGLETPLSPVSLKRAHFINMQKQMIPKAHIIINIHPFAIQPPPPPPPPPPAPPPSPKQKEEDEEGGMGEGGRQEEKEE